MHVGRLSAVLLVAATLPVMGTFPPSAQTSSHAGPLADAQTGSSASDPASGRGSGLVIWRVIPHSPLIPVAPASLSPEVKSQTAGSFGQPASTAGTASSDTGQTAGSFGQTSSNTGQTAGSFGQTAGSLGQTSSSIGQTAGSAGQTAGSFGESIGDIAAIAPRKNGSSPQQKTDPDWDNFTSSVGASLHLNVAFKDVGVAEVASRLQDVSGTQDAPDLLVGTPFPPSWSRQDSGLVRQFGLVTLGDIGLIPQEEMPEANIQRLRVQASILRAAPNLAGARAFLLRLSDTGLCGTLCQGREPLVPQLKAAAASARSALSNVLSGQGLGLSRDPEAAPFNAQLAQMAALNISDPDLVTNLNIRIETTNAEANSRLAVVVLRAVLENQRAFGVVHALVLLRKDDSGRWRVLQITPNLEPSQLVFAWRLLYPYDSKMFPETTVPVLGVAQAAPADGDSRERSPDLWWDNRGGATLETVEWQRKASDIWTSSNLFFVPDDGGHLRTRVTARFADSPANYRWRIWSLGQGGVVVISPWRSLNILSHN